MITINSDGGSRGNPGSAALGVLIRNGNEILLEYREKLKGKQTNNYAEYMGLIRSLQLAQKFTTDELTCVLDSELIVKQLLGEYAVKSPKLKPLFLKVQELQENFKKVTYKHVKRKEKYQKMADWLVNKALDE
jgi:ribonuclease HI